MSSSNSPCAACKFLRRKCTQGCVFSPYFPPDQPQKFANVHRVFGASNVAKLLNELSPAQREDAVNSLAYEAQARISDPIYGCVGYISVLQHKLTQIKHDLYTAKKELSAYIGPAALGPFLPPHHSLFATPFHQHASASAMPSFGVPGMGLGLTSATPPQMILREQHHHQQQLEAQQLAVAAAAAAREQEILRSLEQQQQQHEIARFNNSGFVDGRGFNGGGVASSVVVPAASSPSQSQSGLALVSPQQFDNPFHVNHQNQQQQLLHLHQYTDHQPPPQQQHHQRAGSDEGRSGIGPTS